MKKTQILLLMMFASCAAWAEDNKIYFTDAAVRPGETTNIELCLKNDATDLTCLEAEIQLPEGLNIVCDEEGNPLAKLYRNRMAGHEILTNVLEGGNLKLLISSIDGNVIKEGEGPLLSFCVQAVETAPTGECSLETVGETLLVNNEAEAYYSVGVTGNVLITDDATSVNEELRIKNEELDTTYDLGGRKVVNNKMPRGIFIKNSKKIIGK